MHSRIEMRIWWIPKHGLSGCYCACSGSSHQTSVADSGSPKSWWRVFVGHVTYLLGKCRQYSFDTNHAQGSPKKQQLDRFRRRTSLLGVMVLLVQKDLCTSIRFRPCSFWWNKIGHHLRGEGTDRIFQVTEDGIGALDSLAGVLLGSCWRFAGDLLDIVTLQTVCSHTQAWEAASYVKPKSTMYIQRCIHSLRHIQCYLAIKGHEGARVVKTKKYEVVQVGNKNSEYWPRTNISTC